MFKRTSKVNRGLIWRKNFDNKAEQEVKTKGSIKWKHKEQEKNCDISAGKRTSLCHCEWDELVGAGKQPHSACCQSSQADDVLQDRKREKQWNRTSEGKDSFVILSNLKDRSSRKARWGLLWRYFNFVLSLAQKKKKKNLKWAPRRKI